MWNRVSLAEKLHKSFAMMRNEYKNSKLKRRLASRELTLGSWLTINHQSVVEIMGTAGFEWLCIDIEHRLIQSAM